MNTCKRIALTFFTAALVLMHMPAYGGEAIDASDPTKIYSYAGLGYKYTAYTNHDHLQEIRTNGQLGLSESDMLTFEIGYGKYQGTVLPGEHGTGLTNARARWFHLASMDSSVTHGYRGWATQVDLQLEGSVKGTKGTNTLALGVLPAFAINPEWSLYLPLNYVSTWNHAFKKHQGHGISFAPMAAYAPADGPWPGFFLQIWPSYTRYIAGNLKGKGGANIDLTLGWTPADRMVVTATLQHNFDKNLSLYIPNPGASSGPNDWNLFISTSFYF